MSVAAERLVEFYFDFSSPYSYLAATRIEEICDRRHAVLVWKPILLGPIFRQIGKRPLLERPVEGDHARIDLKRWADHLGVPIAWPPVFPVNGLTACRAYPFARDAGLGGVWCRSVLEACWGEGKDIGKADVLESVARRIGLDPARLIESTGRPEIKEWLRAEVDEAQRRGVFGAPVFFANGEMFYGQDRLFMLEEALEPSQPATRFNRWFGIRCLSRQEGRSEYELIVTPSMTNRRGVAHGGAVTSLLDSALGAAVVSGIEPREWCATLELSVQFREPVRTGRVLASGRMAKRGRHAAFAEGEVLDGSGRILATAHGTWYVWPGRPH